MVVAAADLTVWWTNFVPTTEQNGPTEPIVSSLGISPESKEIYATPVVQTFDVYCEIVHLCYDWSGPKRLLFEMQLTSKYSPRSSARSLN
jgi:hypothetical protein